MGKDNIIDKLRALLTKQPFTEESQVLFLMVSIRKIIEYKSPNTSTYKVLKFYCDWLAHIQKDKNSTMEVEIKTMIEQLYNGAKAHIEQGSEHAAKNALEKFFDFAELQKELLQFFNDELLPNVLCYGTNCWISFIKLMCSILSDTPIVNTTVTNVEKLVLLDKGNGKIEVKIYFTTPISDSKGSYKWYDFYYSL